MKKRKWYSAILAIGLTMIMVPVIGAPEQGSAQSPSELKAPVDPDRMQLRVREMSVFIPSAIFLLLGALSVAQGDNILEADGPGQNLTSISKIYSTSTAQPAVLAIHGGTILKAYYICKCPAS
jgi:hypothetical protein